MPQLGSPLWPAGARGGPREHRGAAPGPAGCRARGEAGRPRGGWAAAPRESPKAEGVGTQRYHGKSPAVTESGGYTDLGKSRKTVDFIFANAQFFLW